jgi:spore germination cell wall hydrolase CwlJ-like protein
MREPTREELLKHELLALQIIKKQHTNPVANSKFFHDTRISNPWKDKKQVAVIGNMIFY